MFSYYRWVAVLCVFFSLNAKVWSQASSYDVKPSCEAELRKLAVARSPVLQEMERISDLQDSLFSRDGSQKRLLDRLTAQFDSLLVCDAQIYSAFLARHKNSPCSVDALYKRALHAPEFPMDT